MKLIQPKYEDSIHIKLLEWFENECPEEIRTGSEIRSISDTMHELNHLTTDHRTPRP